jgi:hypothetical protein
MPSSPQSQSARLQHADGTPVSIETNILALMTNLLFAPPWQQLDIFESATF